MPRSAVWRIADAVGSAAAHSKMESRRAIAGFRMSESLSQTEFAGIIRHTGRSYLCGSIPGRTNVLGRRIRGAGMGGLAEVIGIVQDGKYVSLTEAPRPALFRAATQVYNGTTVLIAR